MANVVEAEAIQDGGEMMVRMCADCDNILVTIPPKGGWYCIKCKFFPSMQDTYMQKFEVER